jgi:hypothetical protein
MEVRLWTPRFYNIVCEYSKESLCVTFLFLVALLSEVIWMDIMMYETIIINYVICN